jgi:hypothetical protein
MKNITSISANLEKVIFALPVKQPCKKESDEKSARS